MTHKPAALTADRLSLKYGPLPVLREASLTVEVGQRVAVLGGNASGKTSLLRAIAGYERPWSGEIRWHGQRINDWPIHRRVRLGFAFCAAERPLFPDMSVLENLRMGTYIGTLKPQGVSAHGDAQLARVLDLFPGLRAQLGQRAGSLSGGEQKTAALARSLLLQPRLLLLDEPTLGLSTAAIGQLAQILMGLSRDGISLLFTEQNVTFAARLAQRLYVLEQGALSAVRLQEGTFVYETADPED